MQDEILDKTIRINMLFDFYQLLLTEKQQMFLRYYYNDNYSLGEIAAEFEISRQAVYEHIKRAEHMLEEYETKLQLFRRYGERSELLDDLRQAVEQLPDSHRGKVLEIVDRMDQLD